MYNWENNEESKINLYSTKTLFSMLSSILSWDIRITLRIFDPNTLFVNSKNNNYSDSNLYSFMPE